MYVALFQIAGYAMAGWLLLILLPTWRVTRWAARSSVFPVYLSLLYVAGIVPLMVRLGPGMMRDFGNAEGVLGLLSRPDVALVAWIHILAFDQVVALMIYRDNMEHRWVPLPVQSVVLFATLMFGPVGFVSYLGLRALSRHWRAARAEPAERVPSVGRVGAEGGVWPAARETGARMLALFARERVLTGVAMLGLVLGAACAGAIALRGELVAPEGHLAKAMAFDVAVGVYLLTLVLLLPLARFSARQRSAWVAATVVLTLFAYGMENVQIARGLDPRFTRAGSPVDQILGGFFFLAALGLVALFGLLAWFAARRRTDGADAPLLLAVRYGAAATAGAFAAGIWMSAVSGSHTGAASILPLHAAGFHGLQAVPLVAVLVTWAGVDGARGWVHAAGCAWLAVCAAIAWQTVAGHPLNVLSPASALALGSFLVWAAVAAASVRIWAAPPRHRPARA